jgi:hypothetical protein
MRWRCAINSMLFLHCRMWRRWRARLGRPGHRVEVWLLAGNLLAKWLIGRLSACLPGFPTGQVGLDGIVRIARHMDELTTVRALLDEMKACAASWDAELTTMTPVQIL